MGPLTYKQFPARPHHPLHDDPPNILKTGSGELGDSPGNMHRGLDGCLGKGKPLTIPTFISCMHLRFQKTPVVEV